jgi:hypothetical protein
MFTKNRRKSSYLFTSTKYSRRRSIPTPWLLAALPVGLLLLELLLRLGVGIAGKGAEMNAYEGEPAIATDYRFKPFSSDGKPVQGIPGTGRLAVQTHPLTGYQLMPSQRHRALSIGAQGFRGEATIAPVKPKNEVRILVLGGSMAFGSMASQDQVVFAQQLEQRFNQQVQQQKSNPQQFRPDVLPYFADEMDQALRLPPKIRAAQYRVINAAVPGYVSSNTVADFSTRLATLNPDLIVLVDGYADLLMPDSSTAASLNTDHLSARPIGHFLGSLAEGCKGIFNHLYLTKTFRYWVLKPQPSLASVVDPLASNHTALGDRLPDTANLKPRVDRYRQHLQQLAVLSGAMKTPLIVALQPELSQRPANKRSAEEQQRLDQLGKPYVDRVQSGYQSLQQAITTVKQNSGNVSVLTLQPALDKVGGTAFQDTIHLSDPAQTAISDRLYDAIAPRLHTEAKPFAGSR